MEKEAAWDGKSGEVRKSTVGDLHSSKNSATISNERSYKVADKRRGPRVRIERAGVLRARITRGSEP